MATQTVTIHAVAPQYAAQIQVLTDILLKHQNDDDLLSQDLLDFGTGILRVAKENRSAPPEEQARIAAQYIQILAQKYLKCPFFVKNFLENTVLGKDGWPYSRKEYLICYDVCDKISPFDGNPMEKDPPDHEFAKEMMDLAGILPKKEEGKDGTVAREGVGIQDPVQRAGRKFIYEQLAALAIERRRSQRLRRGMGTSLMKTTSTLAQMRISGANMLQESEARALAAQATLARDVELYKSTCAAEIEACKKQMAFLETAHQQKISLLQQQAAANAAQASIVQTQVKAMNEAHQKEIAALGVRMTSLQTAHQQLQSQREQEARSYQSALTTIHQTHQTTVTAMAAKQKKELEGYEVRVSAATQQTQQLMRENAALKADQNVLRANLARANRELREVQDQDSGWCVLS